MSRVRQRSLVTRLVLYLVILSPVAVILLGALAFLGARSALQDSMLEQLEVASTLRAEALEAWLEDQRKDFRLVASLPAIQQSTRTLLDPKSSEEEKRRSHEGLDQVFSLLVGNKDAWRELLVLSPRGQVVVSSLPAHENDYRVLDRYFLEGRSGPALQKVYPSPQDFVPTITLSTPMLIGDQPAVLALHLDLQVMDQILLASSGLGEPGDTYLVDPFNVFVSGQRIGREDFPRGVRSQGIDAALEGNRGAGIYDDYRGRPVLGVWRWIDPIGLALLVEMPQSQAFAPAQELARRLLLFGLVITLVLSVGIFLLARQISRPISAITEAALAVAEGELDTRAPIYSRDEVGLLAQTFNRMVGELKAKNDELERFSYTVSHDLKSPLVTIRGFLGLLERDLGDQAPESARRDIARIKAAAETMSQLLDDLLALSRVGRVAKTLHPVPLDSVLDQVRNVLSGPLAEGGVTLEVQSPLPSVLGDSTRLLEVFQNLIENAIKFRGQQPEPRIEIGARTEAGMVQCWVQDNGIGIEREHHESIFGLFDRVETQVAGSGVGLTLVRRIIEVHGGTIHVESEGRHQGSKFVFTLPSVQFGNHFAQG